MKLFEQQEFLFGGGDRDPEPEKGFLGELTDLMEDSRPELHRRMERAEEVVLDLEEDHDRIFSPMDRALGQLLFRLDPERGSALSLAGSLASYFRSNGHTCVDLSGDELPRVADERGRPVRFPMTASRLREHLETSPMVGEPGAETPLILDHAGRLYLQRLQRAESWLAKNIIERVGRERSWRDETALKAAADRAFGPDDENLQKIAGLKAWNSGLTVITGGPGTGKTYTAARIIAMGLESGEVTADRIAIAAPTGKAATRLDESLSSALGELLGSGESLEDLPRASTVHRLLGMSPDGMRFRYHADFRLPCELLILDEASMVDLVLFARLFQALPDDARVILLGDRDQLVSVEAGSILGDLCGEADRDGPLASQVVRLQRARRYASTSPIHQLAQAINAGDGSRVVSLLEEANEGLAYHPASDLAWVTSEIQKEFIRQKKATTPEEAVAFMGRARTLTALREGLHGVAGVNLSVERALRREGQIGLETWYAGRPVLVTRNDYSLNLFNGDLGVTWEVEAGVMRILFPGADGVRFIAPAEMPPHETAFAMTIHKSQGSEFDEVQLYLPPHLSPILTRELLYTGVTRARQGLRICASPAVIESAVQQRIQRASGLAGILWP